MRCCTSVIPTAVKAKHKFPVADLKAGDEVYMYGVLVGIAHDLNKGRRYTGQLLIPIVD